MEALLKTYDRQVPSSDLRTVACTIQHYEFPEPTDMPSLPHVSYGRLMSEFTSLRKPSLAWKRNKLIHDWKELKMIRATLVIQVQQVVWGRTGARHILYTHQSA